MQLPLTGMKINAHASDHNLIFLQYQKEIHPFPRVHSFGDGQRQRTEKIWQVGMITRAMQEVTLRT